ncbi:hypothetical protein PS943_02826 [Pseudomonas fluorescens]|uniref:Uncharacterized protein n=1 Tax=Pseudomonas fluorescens TaxID=294 RepID=A0A5E7WAY6_PSEFL|nr:hypothetical protein [Pseudomonas fluorescens]VVQ32252.1 hypothetical protein PS943_02826 [Pseudomonas fluorescens]
MLELNSRFVIFYGLSIAQVPDTAPKPGIDRCLTSLRTKFKKGELFLMIDGDSACIRVADMKVNLDKKLAAILFQYADKKVADPVFSDLESGKLREESKLLGEGVAISAHALISMQPTKAGGSEFQMLLEDVPGIGKTKIERFLKHFLKALLTTTYKEIGSVKDIKTYPSASLEPFASKTLRDDLEKGTLSFIELTREFPIKALDELPETGKIVNSIKIKPKDKPQGKQAIGFINKITNYGKIHRFDDVKVVFKRADDQQKTVNFSSLREDAGDICFGKVEKIEVNHILKQCVSVIDVKLIDKMKSLL